MSHRKKSSGIYQVHAHCPDQGYSVEALESTCSLKVPAHTDGIRRRNAY